MSRRCPGDVPEMSRRCPGDVPEVSRRCPGGFPDVPHMWLVSNSEDSCFFWFWSNIFFVFFFFVFGVSSVLALKRLVAFNSICKSPFVLFVVQSLPSIFCFTVVLCCFSLLGRDGDLNFQSFKFSSRNCFENQVEAKMLGFFSRKLAQTNVMKCLLYTENEMPHQGSTQKQKALQTRQSMQTAFMTNLYSKATVAIKLIMTNNNPKCLIDISVFAKRA